MKKYKGKDIDSIWITLKRDFCCIFFTEYFSKHFQV